MKLPPYLIIPGLVPVFEAIELLLNKQAVAYAQCQATGVIVKSEGITSVTKVATGNYDVVYSQKYIDIPIVVATCRLGAHIAGVAAETATGCQVRTRFHDGASIDQAFNIFVVGRT